MDSGKPSKAEVSEQRREADVLRREASGHLNRALTTRTQLERIREINGIKEAIMQRRRSR